ncbi:hypothetical protein CK203_008831 [Vitis vinifera]|uniref:Uncharacterized protein n=1 Tax=Vitis vinifera TaxID=29760 RepID=A0A438CN33_VITVI|nr:hypothetical protein CK203_090185 [Vitis vinifera]RVX19227.1 hypothetical protein CK203_008831 [Vitis vinifera]
MSFPYQGGKLTCKVLRGWSICVEAEGASLYNGDRLFTGSKPMWQRIESLKRSRKFQPEDRLFSLSSITSPAELAMILLSQEKELGDLIA